MKVDIKKQSVRGLSMVKPNDPMVISFESILVCDGHRRTRRLYIALYSIDEHAKGQSNYTKYVSHLFSAAPM